MTDIQTKNNFVKIWTDGACSGNPGKGSYGIYMIVNDEYNESYCGYTEHTTNNQMELLAMIVALRESVKYNKVDIYTDSKYVYEGITKWLPNWIKKNQLKNKKNPNLWAKLNQLNKTHPGEVFFHWVKGHNGNEGNEAVDAICKKTIVKESPPMLQEYKILIDKDLSVK